MLFLLVRASMTTISLVFALPRYIDFVGTWGPAICGHANDEVLDAIKAQMDKGTSFGAPCALENELAKMVIDAVPSVEMVRFTNSGTEACMGMLRVVRAFTGREKVIKFNGCYHGHADGFLVQAGSGVATLGLPDSPGVPGGSTKDTLVAKYNDLASVEALIKEHEVAAVILEPVVGNSGFIPPTKEFLEGLRKLTTDNGALLVFDEVCSHDVRRQTMRTRRARVLTPMRAVGVVVVCASSVTGDDWVSHLVRRRTAALRRDP